MSHPKLGRRVGSGTYGEVYLAVDKDGREVAVKRVRTQSIGQASEALQEAFMLQRFSHPNIVQYHQVYLLEEGEQVYVCLSMDFYREGDLQALLLSHSPPNPLPLPQLLGLAHDVAGALMFLHSMKVIHRDLKPQNILLYGGRRHACLTDFGIARSMDSSHRSTIAGTPLYMAPEQARGKYSEPADLWALGCVIFDMMVPNMPDRPVMYMEAMMLGEAFATYLVSTMRMHADWPERLVQLVMSLTDVREERRPTALEAQTALSSLLPSAPAATAQHTRRDSASSVLPYTVTPPAPATIPRTPLAVSPEMRGKSPSRPQAAPPLQPPYEYIVPQAKPHVAPVPSNLPKAPIPVSALIFQFPTKGFGLPPEHARTFPPAPASPAVVSPPLSQGPSFTSPLPGKAPQVVPGMSGQFGGSFSVGTAGPFATADPNLVLLGTSSMPSPQPASTFSILPTPAATLATLPQMAAPPQPAMMVQAPPEAPRMVFNQIAFQSPPPLPYDPSATMFNAPPTATHPFIPMHAPMMGPPPFMAAPPPSMVAGPPPGAFGPPMGHFAYHHQQQQQQQQQHCHEHRHHHGMMSPGDFMGMAAQELEMAAAQLGPSLHELANALRRL